MVMQHGQQWFSALISQCRRILQELYDEEFCQQMNEFGLRIILFLQRSWEDLQFQIRSFQFSTRVFYQQLGNLFSNEGI